MAQHARGGEPFAVLLRPDNYVGYISAEPSPGELDAYLKGFVGRPGEA